MHLHIVSRVFIVFILASFGLVGCGDEDTESDPVSGDPGGQAGAAGMPGGEGGSSGELGSDDDSDITFGASYEDTVALDHGTVVRIIERNVTQHMDELDTALSMLEDSDAVNTLLDLLPSEEEDEEFDENGEPINQEDDGGEPLDVDLSDIKDSILELLLEDILVEAGASLSDDDQTVTYRLVPDAFCTQDPEEDESEDDARDRLENEADCARRISDTPIRIHAVSSGENKLQLTLQVGEEGPQSLSIQIQDDLIAGFIALSEIKAFIEVFVDAEDFEFPTTMNGLIAFEIKREDASHFSVRFGVVDAIEISSPEADSMSLNFGVDQDLGAIEINGPAATISGRAEIGTIDLNFPWQDVVEFFHDDEDEVEWVCTNNREHNELCRQYRDECAPMCDSIGERAEYDACIRNCAEGMPEDMSDAVTAFHFCVREISPEECDPNDWDCRSTRCEHTRSPAAHYCDYREECEEVRTPAPPAATVNGTLNISVPTIHGQLAFDGATDIIQLTDIGLGSDSTEISVNGDTIVRVDINPDDGRQLGVRVSGQPNENIRFELTPKLDARVMFAMHNINDVMDMPDVMQDETITGLFDGAETPTIETIGENDDERDMRVSAGQLTLRSTAMTEDVIIGEGMCMGSTDDDDLSDEERDARHDLFGELTGVMCGG